MIAVCEVLLPTSVANPSTSLRSSKAVRDGDMKLVSDNGKEELHNLADDESERKNLLPQAEPIGTRLRAKLEAWERDVAAPRLRDFPAGH